LATNCRPVFVGILRDAECPAQKMAQNLEIQDGHCHRAKMYYVVSSRLNDGQI